MAIFNSSFVPYKIWELGNICGETLDGYFDLLPSVSFYFSVVEWFFPLRMRIPQYRGKLTRFEIYLPQERKLRDEIDLLEKDIREQDAYIKGRKSEAAEFESLISGYRQGYNQYKVERDKLHDERKYDYYYACFFTRCFSLCGESNPSNNIKVIVGKREWAICWNWTAQVRGCESREKPWSRDSWCECLMSKSLFDNKI